MSNSPAKTARVPDAAIAAFAMVCLLAMICNPVSLAFLGNVFLPALTFLGHTIGAMLHAVATLWDWVTPW